MFNVFKFFPALLATGFALTPSAFAGQARAATAGEPLPPLAQIVERSMLPRLEYLFERLADERIDLTLDGVRVFDADDKFLPGKIAKGFSTLLLDRPRAGPVFEKTLAAYRDIAAMTVDQRNESWGIYYYVSALHEFDEAGLLEKAIDPETLAKLESRLDWRTFVRVPDYTLINLPTNYYGVAFSISRLRHLLGWEDATASEILLEKMLDHYRTYSGEFGFSDETEGHGRFDRYSVLLIGEICQRFIETGMEVSPQLEQWLRRAVDVILVGLNPEGEGFQFGRSIGPYADSAYNEVLTAAAFLDVLTPEEKAMAYAFHVRAAKRFVEFWHDDGMKSVNIWEHGRRTDAYRGKHRILGENLSLLHQHIHTSKLWEKLGLADQAPDPGFVDWLRALPRFTLTWFARGEHDRALLTFRDDLRVVQLPLINGGPSQHMHNPYFPIPYSSGLVQGVADASFPQLLPRFHLADGSNLTAAAYIRNINTKQDGDTLVLTYEQTELDRLDKRAPIKDHRLAVETIYRIRGGEITREDRYIPNTPLEGVKITMEFASFSEDARIEGNRVIFGRGAAREFVVTGFDSIEFDLVAGDPEYRAPTGQMLTRIRCSTTEEKLAAPVAISWTLRWQ